MCDGKERAVVIMTHQKALGETDIFCCRPHANSNVEIIREKEIKRESKKVSDPASCAL